MFKCDTDEDARLGALYRYEILDSEPEESFDRITRLAKNVLQMPMVVVSLVDRDRQWFKSRQGVTATETPRAISFCTHTIRDNVPLIVRDAHADPRFAHSPLVTGEPHIRYYIGIPLRSRDGHNIGALCAMDTNVRDLNSGQVKMLEDLARLVVDEMELRLLASIDSLTGVLSRRSFLDAAERDLQQSIRSGSDLSCAVIDLDHFKSINDTYGHGAGDTVLQQVIAACREQLRSSDYIGRTGGEEFTAIFRDTSITAAVEAAERLRSAIESTVVELDGRKIRISASIGVAQRTNPDWTLSDLMQAADAAMYLAKSLGRNRTVPSPDCEQGGLDRENETALARTELTAPPFDTAVDIYDDRNRDRAQSHLDYLEGARTCFHHAKHGMNEKMKALFADIALDYLRLAHEKAAVMPVRRTEQGKTKGMTLPPLL